MRIGETAALVGITPRAVRHYHHLGLLPEPPRRSNGYGEYGIRDAVLLARIRRLTELGLGFDEAQDVLTDGEVRDLVEVLQELDEDLGRQEGVVQERRTRLARLQAEVRSGRPAAEGPAPPGFTRLLAGLGDVASCPMAVQDREHLAFLDAVVPEADRGALMATLHGMREHAGRVYGLLDALTDVESDDPRVARAATTPAAVLPDGLAVHTPAEDAGALAEGILADLAAAQSAAVRRAMELVTQRQEGSS
jgi:DNA-binding transcriptional MerR regulator